MKSASWFCLFSCFCID